MITLLRKSLQVAMEKLKHHAELVNWKDANNINEAVFRFFVLAEIMKQVPHAKCQTEWKRYDLVVTIGKRSFAIEFKFYVFNRTYNLTDMKPEGWKGGAGKNNEKEFRACLKKLRKPIDAPIDGKYLVLVYQSGPREDHKGLFETSYDNIQRYKGVKGVRKIRHCFKDHAVCKLITVE